MTMLRREDVQAAIERRIKSVGVAEEAYMLNGMPDEKREMSNVAAGLMMAILAIDALPAAEPEQAEGGEQKPEKPPMLLGRRSTVMGGIWVWMTRREADWSSQWHGSDDCDYKSRDLLAVDRAASDEAVLKLYDADIAALRRKG